MAPVFEVLERPNEWDRRLHSIARETHEISELGRFRREFWAGYVTRFPDHANVKTGFAASSNPFTIPEINMWLVIYLGQNEVGIFLRGDREEPNDEVYERLDKLDPNCWNQLGVTLQYSSNSHYTGKSLIIDCTDKTNWPEKAEWLHQEVQAYRSALLKSIIVDPS